jgi:uncharacterized protein (TIGR03032 family)
MNAQPNAPQKQQETAPEPAAKYSISSGFVGLLANLNISVAVSSYQSGRLYLLGRNPKGGFMVNEQPFRKAMGMHYDGETLHLASLAHIHKLDKVLTKGQLMGGQFTQCFVPRTSYSTGQLDAHDVGILENGEVVFVNTRFNCLATLSKNHSFKPYWTPSFISGMVQEDRCHLNGLAMDGTRPAYVTAVCRSDTIDGWRDRRADGGIVMDVESGEIICQGLSMPHSPRIHQGRLFVLNSGTGELGEVVGTGKSREFKPLAFCPGFVRGLSFHGKYAFVGLSKPRYERFEGLALDDKLREKDSDPWCGVQVIDIETGQCVHWFRIDGKIGELYDVAVLPGEVCPRSMSPMSDEMLGLVTVEDA